jgi:transposase
VDMRKSIDGLSMVVAQFDHAPTSGALYVFFNRSFDKIKILYWERNGFCLWYKRLEQERFRLSDASGVVQVSQQQLRWLLDGLDYTKLQGHKALTYEASY